MRWIAGKPEEERLGGAEFRPFESVRDPLSVTREFHFAVQNGFAIHRPAAVLMRQMGQIRVQAFEFFRFGGGGRGGGGGERLCVAEREKSDDEEAEGNEKKTPKRPTRC